MVGCVEVGVMEEQRKGLLVRVRGISYPRVQGLAKFCMNDT